MLKNLKTKHQHYQLKYWLIFIGILLPFVVDTVAVNYLHTFRYIQLVPAFLPITGLIFMYAIFWQRTLDIIPIARSEIINNMPDPCVMWNKSQMLIDYNQAASEIFQIREKDMGTSIEEIFRNFPQIKTHSEIQTKDGRYFQVIYKIIPNKGSFHLFKDITDQKRIEEELRNIGHVKTTFMGILSHDLSGNVSNIALLSEILLKNYQGEFLKMPALLLSLLITLLMM